MFKVKNSIMMIDKKPPVDEKTKELQFSSPFDENGVFYFIGTKAKTQNPTILTHSQQS